MRYAIDLPPFGPLADIRLLAEVANEAEQAGWDGFFLWDHLVREQAMDVPDTWVALTAIALRAPRLTIGPIVTPLPRRRPAMLARETTTLDRLTDGRFILGVGQGGGATEWENLGEVANLKTRAAMLDEGLDLLTKFWSGQPFTHSGAHYTAHGDADPAGHVGDIQFLPTPIQQPRIPIWVAGAWPNKAPFRRAARWDGVVPLNATQSFGEMMSPEQTAEIATYIHSQRPPELRGQPFDIAHWGVTSGADLAADRATVFQYAEVGVTWWRENINPWRFGWSGAGEWPLAAMRNRIRRGPPV